LKVGLEISEGRLAEYKKASEFGKLYQRTLEWVLVRPRSEREVRDYLRKKLRNILRGSFATNEERVSEVSPVTTGRNERVREEYTEFLEDIIVRLKNKGYLDDRKFAEYYVENRFVKKGISQKRLKMELMKKGISKEIIDEVVDARDDEEEILKIKRAKADPIIAPYNGQVFYEISVEGPSSSPAIGKKYKQDEYFCYISTPWGGHEKIFANFTGRIVEVCVKQGNYVRKGEPIAYIERE
jgi:SOS response regulatory protein OraA/RecX